MKEKILILFVFLFGIVSGQDKTYTIHWNGEKILSTTGSEIKLPSFDEGNFNFDYTDGIQFIDQWNTSVEIDESSVTLTNVKYASISNKDLYDLDINTISTKLDFSLKNSKARRKRYLIFTLSPIIRNANGGYKKVVSFQLNYKALSQSQKRSITSRTSKKAIISKSILSTGKWYKFYVDTTGVFRLNKSFLQRLGIDVNNIDPRTIRIFGNGGRMIPYSNSEAYPFDVTENAIKVVGEEDGVFNNSDYVLFYAQGPKGYNAESNTNINAYTDKTYYYVNVNSTLGKRIQSAIEPTGGVDLTISTFQDYQFHEKDIHNIGTIGRRWFGERFNIENEQTFMFNFPDIDLSIPIDLKVYVAAASSTNSSMQIDVNGAAVQNILLGATSNTAIGSGGFYIADIPVTSSNVEVKLNYDNQGNPSALGYLDYISVEATRELKFNDKQFQFKNSDVSIASGIGEYSILNTAKLLEVWDVTDIFNAIVYENDEASNNFKFRSILGEERTYVALSSSDFFEPKLDSNTEVINQDIKGSIFTNEDGAFQDIDYLIVAPNAMLDQAERLAQINKNKYNLNVKVVGLNEVYNEFSTSNQDIGAIRNLVKYIYDNASAPEKRIKYLCLFGDSSYDYKDRIPNNTNIVPSWHSYNSFNLTNAFISDDFYGMMDENEGSMAVSDKLDIAIGRILADTPQRAKDLVDKIETYYTKEAFGRWRNNFVVISDDVDKDWEGLLQETTDEVGNEVTRKKPFVNVVKFHMDAFQQESSAGGETYPKVTEELSNALDNGALVVNYFGHGGEDGLASERVLQKKDIQEFKNFFRLHCFVTVTCEFTKFDNPFRQTAGEFTYWNKESGAIALITTTRQVFVNFGITFNETLGQYLFSFNEDDAFSDYEYPTIAEALRLAKNDPRVVISNQRRLVFSIGDPAMKLAFPQPNVRLTTINDVPVTQETDTLKALSRVKLSGEIVDVNGTILNDFKGEVSTTIYDKPIARQTLANDGTRNDGQVVRLNFQTLGEVIFRGKASVTDGKFNFEFVVPKDITIPVGLGRVSFYAENGQILQDHAGANISDAKIGGVNENAEEDNVGPVVQLFMNDENFVSGGITNESPTFLAKLEDENGINTASGVGHDIVAIIDGDETNPFILNDYYETELDDYTKGTVSFPFRDLEPGLHTLTLKVWDVYNNSSVSELQFVVFDKDQELVINNVLNYPNPFVNYTEFWFNHNSSESLDVSIQIFTVSGKLVRTLNGQTSAGITTTSSLSKDIVWDGRDDFGEKIGKGVYIYKLIVKSNLLNKKVEKIEKLVIL